MRPWPLLTILNFVAWVTKTALHFNVYVLLDAETNIYSDLLIFTITTKILKQLNNEIKMNKRNKTCHIYHVNVWNAAYLISYPVSYFKRAKHVK